MTTTDRPDYLRLSKAYHVENIQLRQRIAELEGLLRRVQGGVSIRKTDTPERAEAVFYDLENAPQLLNHITDALKGTPEIVSLSQSTH